MRRVRGDGMVYRKAFQLFSDLISNFNNGRNYDWADIQLMKSKYLLQIRALMFLIEIIPSNSCIYVLKMRFNEIKQATFASA